MKPAGWKGGNFWLCDRPFRAPGPAQLISRQGEEGYLGHLDISTARIYAMISNCYYPPLLGTGAVKAALPTHLRHHHRGAPVNLPAHSIAKFTVGYGTIGP